jgi:hypothetical protein
MASKPDSGFETGFVDLTLAPASLAGIESLLPAPFHFGIWVACVATKKIFALTDSRINDGLNSAESFIHREFFALLRRRKA